LAVASIQSCAKIAARGFFNWLIQRSSVVERSAVNRLVVGSNPTAGAIFESAKSLFAESISGCFRHLRRHNNDAGWSSLVARQAHNLKVAGSNPAPATNFFESRWLIAFTFFKIPTADFTSASLKMWRGDCSSTIEANRAGRSTAIPGASFGEARSYL
jgi:hypothetical protein